MKQAMDVYAMPCMSIVQGASHIAAHFRINYYDVTTFDYY